MPGSAPPLGRRFWALAAARTVSAAGNGFGRVALAFAVLTLPGATPSTVSMVLACQAVPLVALILVGGAIADRTSRSRLMLTAELAACLAWGGLAVAAFEHASSVPLLCVLAVLAGAATAMFTPAMSGVVPELVDAANRRPIRVAVLATFAYALPMVLLGLGWSVWWCAAAMLVSGLANDVFEVLWSTTMQRCIPRHLLSRVSAYDIFGSLAFAPLGLIVAGPLAESIGTASTLLGCAALTVVVSAAALLSPQVRNLRLDEPVPAAA